MWQMKVSFLNGRHIVEGASLKDFGVITNLTS